MAALSTAQTAPTLTPPSSSHGNNGFAWDFTAQSGKKDNHHYEKRSLKNETTNGIYRSPLVVQNGNASALSLDTSPKASNGGDSVNGPGALSRSYSNEDTPDTMGDGSLDDDHGRNTTGGHSHKRVKGPEDGSDDDSKWIHRDKLAKIENEELQAAGIILPHPRSRSRSRRERSQSSTKRIAQDNTMRSRKNSSHTLDPKTPDTAAAINGWDSRLSEEMEVDASAPVKPTSSGPSAGSRIPVPKNSPLPMSASHIERELPIIRKRENSPEEEQEKRIEMPRVRPRSNSTALKSLEPSPTLKVQPAKRSTTDVSPKKSTPPGSAARKSSAAARTIPPEARGKSKPKGKNSTNGGSSARPSTRSGEREVSMVSLNSKPMEGDPPWMVSAYKPDPRLPPDQQLLPTVARRLQQERWEQEGKFGSIYDKDFRPLTDEGFLAPPPNAPRPSGDDIVKQEVEKPEEWPLKSPEAPKSPVSPARSSSYSTMPKIQDKPLASPLTSPKSPLPSDHPPEATQVTRMPDMPEEETKKKEGCGCCIVM